MSKKLLLISLVVSSLGFASEFNLKGGINYGNFATDEFKVHLGGVYIEPEYNFSVVNINNDLDLDIAVGADFSLKGGKYMEEHKKMQQSQEKFELTRHAIAFGGEAYILPKVRYYFTNNLSIYGGFKTGLGFQGLIQFSTAKELKEKKALIKDSTNVKSIFSTNTFTIPVYLVFGTDYNRFVSTFEIGGKANLNKEVKKFNLDVKLGLGYAFK